MSKQLDKVKLVKGRKWERQDPLDNIGVSTYSLIKDAIKEGKNDLASDLAEYLYFQELKFQKDANLDLVGGFPQFFMANYGEADLYNLYKRMMMRVTGVDKWPVPPIGLRDIDSYKWAMNYAARMVRPHRMGREDGAGGFTMEEYDDRWEILWEPCYSGGRTRRGDPISNTPAHTAPPYNYYTNKVQHDWSWGKTGVTGYCLHCAVLHELMDIEQTGGYMQQWVVGYNDNPWDPCRYVVYKDLDWIPEECYTRLGKTKPKVKSKKPAPKNPKLLKVMHSDELGPRYMNALRRFRKAMCAGDKEDALKAVDQLDGEMWLWSVAYPLTWTWGWSDMLVEQHGYNELYHCLRSIPSWMEPPLPPDTPRLTKATLPSVEERVRRAALWGRADRCGSDESSVRIVDEGDKYVMELTPCGSVGRNLTLKDSIEPHRKAVMDDLDMSYYFKLPIKPFTGPPQNLKSTTKAHDVAWNKIGVPHACTRCCVHFEHGALARNGYLTTIIERPTNNTDPNCRWLFYKDVDDIPEKYYERIGATKPKRQK